jgi:hypothetical protein
MYLHNAKHYGAGRFFSLEKNTHLLLKNKHLKDKIKIGNILRIMSEYT